MVNVVVRELRIQPRGALWSFSEVFFSLYLPDSCHIQHLHPSTLPFPKSYAIITNTSCPIQIALCLVWNSLLGSILWWALRAHLVRRPMWPTCTSRYQSSLTAYTTLRILTSSSLLPVMWMNWTAINHTSKKTSEVSALLNLYSECL